MNNDPKGYYALLGVKPDASAAAIKAAFHALAKRLHPDSGKTDDGGKNFQAVSEAYSALGDPERRRAYDNTAFHEDASNSSRTAMDVEPISCSECGHVTAQPRHLIFWRVVSVVLASVRTPIQGIYCSACARKVALKATAISAIVGWWGVPWGPIWTIKEIVTNAFGGSNNSDIEERLLLHNALAFALKGEVNLAASLAQKLKHSSTKEISEKADLILGHLGKDPAARYEPLRNPWKPNPANVLTHVGLLSAIPALAIVLLAQSDTQAGDYTARPETYADASYLPTLPIEATTTPSGGAAVPEAPRCAQLPSNGEILGGSVPMSSEGHVLEIKNGTAGPSIVKVRDARTRALVRSFYVESDNTAALQGIPDGVYVIQYAFGPALADDCKSFTSVSAAGEFPQPETFTTDVIDMGSYGTQLRWSRLSYTLYAVPEGNVRPQSLDAAEFNAD